MKVAAIAVVVWASAVMILQSSELGRVVEYQIATRLDFWTRSQLGLGPSIDPKLKIFGYDDAAVSEFRDPDIRLEDWARLLRAMTARQPKTILVDKMYSFFPDQDLPHVQPLVGAVGEHRVGVGAFVDDYLIRYRAPLDLNRGDYRLDAWTEGDVAAAGWLPRRSPNVYGPDSRLAAGFRHVGHLLYPGFGRIDPLLRVNANTAVPHLALFAADSRRLKADGLYLDGRRVPLDDRRQLQVNFSDPSRYFQATYSLKRTLTAARRGEELKQIQPGDTVLVLPLLYTGNLDVVDTPIGRMPGGFVLAGVINSALSGQWLRPAGRPWAAVLVAALLGAVMGLAFSPLRFWPVLVGLVGGIVGLSVAAFAYRGLVVPWFYPVVTLGGCGISSYAINMTARLRASRRLHDALKGSVPEPKLKAILQGKGRLNLEASERIVTLMFIDIANFSVVAEQSSPKQVFMRLKTILREVTATIHRYGGTVDRTLGDGILCFFGYSYDGEVMENQADQAVRCAIEIQRDNVRRCLEAARAGEAILPLRIGINTGAVYIGDVGSDDRIDFTVIGNGVNYAQRLEAACDHHTLMISGTTMDFAASFSAGMPGFTRRYIHIKHHDELLEAIEYNPLHDEPELRRQALTEFRKSFNLERKEQRWPVDDPSRLGVATEFGDGTLIDFSSSGLCVKMSRFLSKGVTFTMTLRGSDAALNERLEARGLATIKVEVRWGKTTEDGYAHGLKLVNLADTQLAALFALMREVFSRSKDPGVVVDLLPVAS